MATDGRELLQGEPSLRRFSQASTRSSSDAEPMGNSEPGPRTIHRIPAGKSIEDFYFVGSTLSICQQNPNSSRPILKEVLDVPALRSRIVKIIHKSRIPASAGGERLWRRLCEKLLNLDPHVNVMRIYEVLENDECYYVIMEKLEGGELFDFLLNERAVPEETCKFIMRQIFRAIEYLHSQQLLHRDIKPENLMFRFGKRSRPSGSQQHELALIDYDTCKMIDIPTAEYKEVVNGKRRLVGTYGYLAPEVLKGGEYTKVSDLWSIGVILYILMTGVPPVPMDLMNSAKESLEVLTKTESAGIDFDMSPLPDFPRARDLCKRLLEFNPHKRLKQAHDALRHPWLAERVMSFRPRSSAPQCGGAVPPSSSNCSPSMSAPGGAAVVSGGNSQCLSSACSGISSSVTTVGSCASNPSSQATQSSQSGCECGACPTTSTPSSPTCAPQISYPGNNSVDQPFVAYHNHPNTPSSPVATTQQRCCRHSQMVAAGLSMPHARCPALSKPLPSHPYTPVFKSWESSITPSTASPGGSRYAGGCSTRSSASSYSSANSPTGYSVNSCNFSAIDLASSFTSASTVSPTGRSSAFASITPNSSSSAATCSSNDSDSQPQGDKLLNWPLRMQHKTHPQSEGCCSVGVSRSPSQGAGEISMNARANRGFQSSVMGAAEPGEEQRRGLSGERGGESSCNSGTSSSQQQQQLGRGGVATGDSKLRLASSVMSHKTATGGAGGRVVGGEVTTGGSSVKLKTSVCNNLR